MSERFPRTSFLRYIIATGVVFATNFGMTVALTEVVGMDESIAFLLALVTVFILTFILMRYYIYGPTAGTWPRQFLLYAPSALFFRGMEYAAFAALNTATELDYRLLVLIVLGTSWLVKFFYYRLTVFRKPAPADDQQR